MRALPLADPGDPDYATASRYLLWLVRRQLGTVLLGMTYGVVWMLSQALMPAAIGKAIDGLAATDQAALLRWSGALLALGTTQAVAGVLRHRVAVANWLTASYRTIQLTVRHAARLGPTLANRLETGEVVAISTADSSPIGNVLDITARTSGAIVAIITVAAILLHGSVSLGLVVVLGVPVTTALAALLIRPLHHRQQAYRDLQGKLTTRAGDIVAGLRVLRGIGGEESFADRYRAHSQELRRAGVRTARIESQLAGGEILLPGLFVAVVAWLGARMALDGRLTVGQVVAYAGYASFLVSPMRTLTEAIHTLTRGHVAARRVVRFLQVRPEFVPPEFPLPAPLAGELVDAESGLVVLPGRVTALAAARSEDAAAIAARLGGYLPGPVTLGGIPLTRLADLRARILVADNDARLFAGVLREELDPRGDAGERRLLDAVEVASAADVLDALPDGLDTPIATRGRDFSGGQAQRLRLVRALVSDPPILVLVEPTSAVDAHTEARIAARLGRARSGRTTVVATTSPLVLDRADHVAYVEDGKVVAEGTHRALLLSEPRYAATVTRGEDVDAAPETAADHTARRYADAATSDGDTEPRYADALARGAEAT